MDNVCLGDGLVLFQGHVQLFLHMNTWLDVIQVPSVNSSISFQLNPWIFNRYYLARFLLENRVEFGGFVEVSDEYPFTLIDGCF